MKNLIATAATALVLSTGAYAETHSMAFNDYAFQAETDYSAAQLIGMRVYSTENDMSTTMEIEADGEKEWDDIGEINDIIVSKDGAVKAVIVGVGGFLGIGEKDVAVNIGNIHMVREAGDDADDFFLVVNASQEVLEGAAPYERVE